MRPRIVRASVTVSTLFQAALMPTEQALILLKEFASEFRRLFQRQRDAIRGFCVALKSFGTLAVEKAEVDGLC